jgi:hypothetical protein
MRSDAIAAAIASSTYAESRFSLTNVRRLPPVEDE